jgi:hypothetical protein
MPKERNPEYTYLKDGKGRTAAYRAITCEYCGTDAFIRKDAAAGKFCSRACAIAWRHAQGKMPAQARGEEAPGWKGSDAVYSSRHKRVVRSRGAADHCEQRETAGCTSLTYQWAWIHDTDPGDPQNYRQLCRTCHVGYDGHRGEGNARAKLTLADARAIRAKRASGARQKELAAEYGVTQATISLIILNRRYKEPEAAA